jgi:hypothetical protein
MNNGMRSFVGWMPYQRPNSTAIPLLTILVKKPVEALCQRWPFLYLARYEQESAEDVKNRKQTDQQQRDGDDDEEQRAAKVYAEALRIRREEEFRHGLPLARLLELDIPKKSDQRRIRRILEVEEKARQNLEAIRRR